MRERGRMRERVRNVNRGRCLRRETSTRTTTEDAFPMTKLTSFVTIGCQGSFLSLHSCRPNPKRERNEQVTRRKELGRKMSTKERVEKEGKMMIKMEVSYDEETMDVSLPSRIQIWFWKCITYNITLFCSHPYFSLVTS